jgi:hypothetical protein
MREPAAFKVQRHSLSITVPLGMVLLVVAVGGSVVPALSDATGLRLRNASQRVRARTRRASLPNIWVNGCGRAGR